MSSGGFVDYHTHSRYCDGQGELADYYLAALRLGLDQIGFSPHAPVSFASEWHLPASAVASYLDEARAIQDGGRGNQPKVLVGMEVDYLGSDGEVDVDRDALDFVIGSVHYLGRLANGRLWTVDGPEAELKSGIEQTYGGSARDAVEAFFSRVSEMARVDRPDIIGHLDLVKKNNDGLFDERATWYRDALASAVDAIARAECVVEVNTGGVSRGFRADWYPSEWALRRMYETGVPVTFGSDAHASRHVGFQMNEVRLLLHQIGYRSIWTRTKSGWRERALDPSSRREER
jgi:histidinol-phosphatase (PHP family)